MLNVKEMSDERLTAEMSMLKEKIIRENVPGWPSPNDVTIEERDEALEILAEIRAEGRRREWCGLMAMNTREDTERHLNRAKARLEKAIATGKLGRIYSAKNHIRELEEDLEILSH